MTPIYDIQPDILELLNEWQRYVFDLDLDYFMSRKGKGGKFFQEGRSEYSCSMECLRNFVADGGGDRHDGFPPDAHGYDFNQMATWIKHDDVDIKLAREVMEKSQWLDKELGGLINSRFCALKIYYPKNGYIAWHTNHNVPGYNLLFTYNHTGDGYWRHIDPEGSTGIINDISDDSKLVHIPDVKGWHLKTGYYGKSSEHEQVMWHAAVGGPRITLGYVIFDKKMWQMMIEEISGKEQVWPLAKWDPDSIPDAGYIGPYDSHKGGVGQARRSRMFPEEQKGEPEKLYNQLPREARYNQAPR